MSRAHELLNELVGDIFVDILNIEEKALRYCKIKDLSIAEMHVIEQVGDDDPKSMSEVAAALGITMGSLTTAVSRIVRKGYVKRYRPEGDRRIVQIELTRKGRLVYRLHEKFHLNLINQMVKGLSTDEEIVLVKVLENINGFFKKLSKKYKEA